MDENTSVQNDPRPMDNLPEFVVNVVTQGAKVFWIEHKDALANLRGKARHRKVFRDFVKFCDTLLRMELFSKEWSEVSHWLQSLMLTYNVEHPTVALECLSRDLEENAYSRWDEVFIQIPTETEAAYLARKTSNLQPETPSESEDVG